MERKFYKKTVLFLIALGFITAIQAQKITLTSSMVTQENGSGSANALVDEQLESGDPLAGSGSSVYSHWESGWSSPVYYAYINLGQPYNVTNISLFDANSSGNVVVSTGIPNSWTTLFTDDMDGYDSWSMHSVSVNTQYIRLAIPQGVGLNEILIYGSAQSGTSVSGVTLSATTISIDESFTKQLSATVSPSNATDKSVNWSSSNTSVATVSSNGLVTAISAGTAIITVTTVDQAQTATCNVTVNSSVTVVNVNSVSINPIIAAINTGSSAQLSAIVSPSNATDKSVVWSSSNTAIASVSSTGIVSANSVGTATITATTVDQSKTATTTITVNASQTNPSSKIVLTTSMITQENGDGDATVLIDEQSVCDPRDGIAGSPSTKWETGWSASIYYAYIDLGSVSNITEIYLFDGNSSGNVVISTGSPDNWTELFTDDMAGYFSWQEHSVSVSTQYIRIALPKSVGLNEIVIYGSVGPVIPDTMSPSTILNLSAGNQTETSALLSWTAPGDDGNTGTATSYNVRYSTSAITSANFNSATIVSGLPTPAIAGTSQSVNVDGLTSSTTYYFAIKTTDEASNISEISNITSVLTSDPAPADNTAPSAISNLLATNATSSSITLNWTAPGDDANLGTAISYSVCYSTSAITDANFNSATVVSGVPTPAIAGTSQSVNVDGLTASTTYYFAIKTTDEASNISEISNITSILTFDPAPVDNTAPSAISNLLTTNATSNSITLNWTAPGDDANVGTATLYNIRYSTSSITDANFNSATAVTNIPIPSVSGTSQSKIISGLSALTTYYFAIKTSDEKSNISTISNITSASTTELSQTPSLIVITEDMILDKTVRNDGGVPYYLFDEIAEIGDPANGAGGSPSTAWFPGYNAVYPASFYVDLGSDYIITEVYMYDSSGSGDNEFSTGVPYKWDLQFTDDLSHYGSWNKHLINNVETRYIQIKRLTKGGDCPAIAIYGYLAPTDVTAPAQVTNIAVNKVKGNKIVLKWTAVGDNGNVGLPISYDLRYSTSAINSANFDAATPTAVTNPLFPGATQLGYVKGLEANTTYYFAVKAIDDAGNKSLISNVITATSGNAVVNKTITIDKFIGTHGFVDDPVDKMECAGFIREYHNWNWDEGDIWNGGGDLDYPGYPNNKIKFAPSQAGGGIWNFDDFYSSVNNVGLTLNVCLQAATKWIQGGTDFTLSDKPVDVAGASTTVPNNYQAKAHHIYQYAARYGSTVVADGNLTLADDQPRNSGLNLVHYIEDWNEQDGWWNGADGQFSPEEYAAMNSADRDGHCNTMTGGTGTFGVKNADPNMKLVMGGIYHPDVNFLERMNMWCIQNRADATFSSDVINIHHYPWKDGNSGSGGGPSLSPEQDNFEGRLSKIVAFRDKYLDPDVEVWISEFGYDTNPGSPLCPPAISGNDIQETQGQWLVRSFLAFAAAGVDRAVQFMMRDVNSNSTQFFNSCGLVGPKGDWTPKKSWYYIFTMKNLLTGMKFSGKVATENPNVYAYKFKDINGSNGAYVLWCPTINATTVNNYQLTLSGDPSLATLVELTSGSTTGASSALSINGGVVSVDVSERPVFVLVDDIEAVDLKNAVATNAQLDKVENLSSDMQVYPNPANKQFTVTFNSQSAGSLELFDICGRSQQKQTFEYGERNRVFDVSTLNKGVYLLKMESGNTTDFSKVVIE